MQADVHLLPIFEGYFSNQPELQQRSADYLNEVEKTPDFALSLIEIIPNVIDRESVLNIALRLLYTTIEGLLNQNENFLAETPDIAIQLRALSIHLYRIVGDSINAPLVYSFINYGTVYYKEPWDEFRELVYDTTLSQYPRMRVITVYIINVIPPEQRIHVFEQDFKGFFEECLNSQSFQIFVLAIGHLLNISSMGFQKFDYFMPYHDFFLSKFLEFAPVITDKTFNSIVPLYTYAFNTVCLPTLQELVENDFFSRLTSEQVITQFISLFLSTIRILPDINVEFVVQFLYMAINILGSDPKFLGYIDAKEFNASFKLIGRENSFSLVQELEATENIPLILMILDSILSAFPDNTNFYEYLIKVAQIDDLDPAYKLDAISIIQYCPMPVLNNIQALLEFNNFVISLLYNFVTELEPSDELDSALSQTIQGIAYFKPSIEFLQNCINLFSALAERDYRLATIGLCHRIVYFAQPYTAEEFRPISDSIGELALAWLQCEEPDIRKQAYHFFAISYRIYIDFFKEYFSTIAQQMISEFNEDSLRLDIVICFNVIYTTALISEETDLEISVKQFVEQFIGSVTNELVISGAVTGHEAINQLRIASAMVTLNPQVAYQNMLVLCSEDCMEPPQKIFDLYNSLNNHPEPIINHGQLFEVLIKNLSYFDEKKMPLYKIFSDLIRIIEITPEEQENVFKCTKNQFDLLCRKGLFNEGDNFDVLSYTFNVLISLDLEQTVSDEIIDYCIELLDHPTSIVNDHSLMILSNLLIEGKLQQNIIERAYNTACMLISYVNTPYTGACAFIHAMIFFSMADQLPQNIVEIIKIGITKSEKSECIVCTHYLVSAVSILTQKQLIADDESIVQLILSNCVPTELPQVGSPIISYLFKFIDTDYKESIVRYLANMILNFHGLEFLTQDVSNYVFNLILRIIETNPELIGNDALANDLKNIATEQLNLQKENIEN